MKLKSYKSFHDQFKECRRDGVNTYQGELKPLHCTKFNADCKGSTCKHERIIYEDD